MCVSAAESPQSTWSTGVVSTDPLDGAPRSTTDLTSADSVYTHSNYIVTVAPFIVYTTPCSTINYQLLKLPCLSDLILQIQNVLHAEVQRNPSQGNNRIITPRLKTEGLFMLNHPKTIAAGESSDSDQLYHLTIIPPIPPYLLPTNNSP